MRLAFLGILLLLCSVLTVSGQRAKKIKRGPAAARVKSTGNDEGQADGGEGGEATAPRQRVRVKAKPRPAAVEDATEEVDVTEEDAGEAPPKSAKRSRGSRRKPRRQEPDEEEGEDEHNRR